MGPIEKAIDEVRFEIPYEILNETFRVDRNVFGSFRGTQISLEARIREEIIMKRVLVDTNIIGGTEVLVPLAGLPQRYHDDMTFVVTIPKTYTEGKSISSVLSVSQAPDGWMGTMYAEPQSGTMYENRMDALFHGASGGGGCLIDSRVRLIGDNVVYIKIVNETTGDLFLRCRVGFDEQLSTLPQAAWLDFAELTVLATKAHISRELSIRIDEGQLSGGMNVGRFKEYVDEYRDANQLYKEFLTETWGRVMALNDETRHSRAIQFQFGRP